eukprot:gene52-107_t
MPRYQRRAWRNTRGLCVWLGPFPLPHNKKGDVEKVKSLFPKEVEVGRVRMHKRYALIEVQTEEEFKLIEKTVTGLVCFRYGGDDGLDDSGRLEVERLAGFDNSITETSVKIFDWRLWRLRRHRSSQSSLCPLIACIRETATDYSTVYMNPLAIKFSQKQIVD